jgi:hypothetical protein
MVALGVSPKLSLRLSLETRSAMDEITSPHDFEEGVPRREPAAEAQARYEAACCRVEQQVEALLDADDKSDEVKLNTMAAAYHLYRLIQTDEAVARAFEKQWKKADLRAPPKHSLPFSRPLRLVAMNPEIRRRLSDDQTSKRFKAALNQMSGVLVFVEHQLKAKNGGVIPAEIPPGLVVEEVRSAGNLTKALALGRTIKQENQPKKTPRKKPDAAVLEAWNDIATGNREGIFIMVVAAKHDDKGKLVAEGSRIIDVYREDVEECAVRFKPTGAVEQETARHLPRRPSKRQKTIPVEAADKFDEEAALSLNVERQQIVTILRAKPRDPEPAPESELGPASKPEPEKQQAPKPRKVRKCEPDILQPPPPALTQQEALLLRLVTSGPYGIGETDASKQLGLRSVKPTALRLRDAGYITRSREGLDFVLAATPRGWQWVRNNPESLFWTAI